MLYDIFFSLIYFFLFSFLEHVDLGSARRNWVLML